MLLEEFDKNINAVINPNMFREPIPNFPKTVVSIFSKGLFKEIEDNYNLVKLAEVENATKTLLSP